MSTGDGSNKAYGISGLPVERRTIRVPAELWESIKDHRASAGKSIRFLVDDALDAELMRVIESLRQLGFRGEEKADKLVRIPLDDNIIARINYGRRQTGLPAVSLLRACLSRFVRS